MFVKGLRQEAARQNWFGVAVDLVILILGVFLGIQVNNWNQARLDREKGREFRQRLIGDIEANYRDFERRRIYYSTGERLRATHSRRLTSRWGRIPQHSSSMPIKPPRSSQASFDAVPMTRYWRPGTYKT